MAAVELGGVWTQVEAGKLELELHGESLFQKQMEPPLTGRALAYQMHGAPASIPSTATQKRGKQPPNY